jgi:hypothetical protein
MRSRSGRFKRIFGLWAAVFFLLTAAASLHGGGRRDNPLSQADDFINRKQYDEAIQFLTDYIRAHPENFGDAQKRFQRIIQIREQYQSRANALLDRLVENPEDYETILALSREIEALESSTGNSSGEFLSRIMALALFTHNRNLLETILAQGRELLNQGDFSGAFQTYAGGFSIYQEEYFNAGYGEMADSIARRGLETLNRGAGEFLALTKDCNRVLGAFDALESGNNTDLAEIQRLYGELRPILERLGTLRASFLEALDSFENQLALLRQADPALGDRSFLSFASRLIRGPMEEREGILGTVEAYWHSAVPRAERVVFGITDRSYAAAYQTFTGGAGGGADLFGGTMECIRVSLDLINLWDLLYGEAGEPEEGAPEGTGAEGPLEKAVYPERIGEYLKYYAMERSIQWLLDIDPLRSQGLALTRAGFPALSLWREGALPAAEAIAGEDDIRRSYASLVGGLRGLQSGLEGDFPEIRAYRREHGNSGEAPPPGDTEYLDLVNSLLDDTAASFAGQERDSGLRRYTIANGELEKALLARDGEFREAQSLLAGIPRIQEGGGEYLARYPAESLEIFTRMGQSLGGNIAEGRELLSQYGAESPGFLGPAGSLHREAQSMVERLLGLETGAGPLAAQAQTQTAQAESLRREGDRLLQETQNALARNNFDVARDRLSRTTDRYNSSLGIQESASLRSSWDTQLVALGEEITRLQNEVIVREVRGLVNTARDGYFAGMFERAEELLIRARNRWRVTNITDDPEIQYWLTVVQGALSLRSGRMIPVTAPLYAEMSQLLSDAKQRYDEGVRFFGSNQRVLGLAKFNEARKKTQEVKIMFPLNQEAGILEIRMDQVTDPPAFENRFRQRLTEAVAGTRPNVRSLEAFAELQNLAEINPRYPGIREVVIQAEYDMGFRPPPPDPRALAQSDDLTRQAQAIIDGNVRSQFEVALTLLNRALTLNPNNTRAMRAKDLVQTQISGTAFIVIDSESEQLFQQAVQELQNRNTINAYSIVQQLLQKPQNRNSTRILELQRRIESML